MRNFLVLIFLPIMIGVGGTAVDDLETRLNAPDNGEEEHSLGSSSFETVPIHDPGSPPRTESDEVSVNMIVNDFQNACRCWYLTLILLFASGLGITIYSLVS